MPGWIADKQKRLAKIREAREALEAEAAAAAAAKAEAETRGGGETQGREPQALGAGSSPALKRARSQGAAQLYRSRQPRAPDQGRLHPGLQRASGGRRGQANYRGAWTDAEHERLSPTCSPGRCRPGQPRTQAQGDFGGRGLCSEDNLLALATRRIRAYVATGRAKYPAETTRKVGGEMTQTMRQKLKRAGYRSRYRLRKQIVEPVFGQIKQARGFRAAFQFAGDRLSHRWTCAVRAGRGDRRPDWLHHASDSQFLRDLQPSAGDVHRQALHVFGARRRSRFAHPAPRLGREWSS